MSIPLCPMLKHVINIGNGTNKWGNGINLFEYTVCKCIYSSNITFFLNEKVQIHFSTYWNFFSYICYLLPLTRKKYQGGVTERLSHISCFKLVSNFKWPSTTDELWITSADVNMPMSPPWAIGKVQESVYINYK